MLIAQMGRPGLSVSQKTEMWRRWKNGESHSDVGRALGKQAASIHGSIRIRGGIAPLPRTRSVRALSSEEREEISRGVAAGTSMRAIAASIDRAASTVSREIDRNGGLNKYRAIIADDAAWQRARRPKSCRLAVAPRLRGVVTAKQENWISATWFLWSCFTWRAEPEVIPSPLSVAVHPSVSLFDGERFDRRRQGQGPQGSQRLQCSH